MEDEQRSLIILPSKKKLSKKASPSMNAFIRRSARLRNLQLSMSNKEKIVEEIDLTNSDQEEVPLVQQSNSEPLVEQLNSEPLVRQLNSEPMSNLQNLEEKIDFLVQSVREFKYPVSTKYITDFAVCCFFLYFFLSETLASFEMLFRKIKGLCKVKCILRISATEACILTRRRRLCLL